MLRPSLLVGPPLTSVCQRGAQPPRFHLLRTGAAAYGTSQSSRVSPNVPLSMAYAVGSALGVVDTSARALVPVVVAAIPGLRDDGLLLRWTIVSGASKSPWIATLSPSECQSVDIDVW